jgi:tRNA (mo5U34)-methyltransferase
MNSGEVAERAASIPWYHQMELAEGVVTPGYDDTPWRLRSIALPEDLSGQEVLDVGAYDGFFSFEAERRGAARVLATDSFCWEGKGGGSKAGFELARSALGSGVEDAHVDVLELSPDEVGTFDLVLFLGVLYHMRHPLLALERVASVTRGRLILETVVDVLELDRPALAFYPSGELRGDATNWFGPNPAAVIGLLHAAGFGEVKVVPPPPVHEAGGELRDSVGAATLREWFGEARQARLAFHAGPDSS